MLFARSNDRSGLAHHRRNHGHAEESSGFSWAFSCGLVAPARPSLQLLDRLLETWIPALRTGTNSAIHILTKGKNSQCCVLSPALRSMRRSI